MVVRLMNVKNIDSYWKRVSQSLSLRDTRFLFYKGREQCVRMRMAAYF